MLVFINEKERLRKWQQHYKTEEKFVSGIAKSAMDEEVRLRIKAGVIRSWYEGSEADGWTLFTKWNVISEQ